MKISKSDLKQIIQEEALRLFRLEKLEEAKHIVDENIRLISEGKKKMSNEELEELWAGLKSVLGAGAKAVGQAVSTGAQKVQQFGQKVADTYKQGEDQAKMQKLQKQQMDLANQMKKVNDEIAKMQPPAPAQAQKKPTQKTAAKTSGTKTPATKTATPKSTTSKTPATKTTATKNTATKTTATKTPAKTAKGPKTAQTQPSTGFSSYSVTE